MGVQTATPAWSDPVAISTPARAQAEGDRVALYLGTGAPGEDYIVLQPGETIDIPVGSFRVRAAGSYDAKLRWQDWVA